MTPEREKEIREDIQNSSIIHALQGEELLQEIDRLREVLTNVMSGESWRHYALVAQENERLKAMNVTQVGELTEELARVVKKAQEDYENLFAKWKQLHTKLDVAVKALEYYSQWGCTCEVDTCSCEWVDRTALEALSKIRGEK